MHSFAPDPDWTARVTAAVRTDVRGPVRSTRWNGAHTNDIVELQFDHGTLLVKRARHEWARTCFDTSEAAARLIAAESDIVAPQPLSVDAAADTAPLQAYWRIELPTLAQLWPRLSTHRRAAALRSLGTLLRRLHDIVPRGFGPLRTRSAAVPSLEAALRSDLQHRLLPAVYAHWTPGAWLLERVIELVPHVARRHAAAPPALVHGDLHIGNVLCSVRDDDVHCVGLLDLDGAVGSTAESDIACFEILHGPLFGQRLVPRWHRLLRADSGDRVDPGVVAFFRCAHLANQGFTSGLLGHTEHAAVVEHALRRNIDHAERTLCTNVAYA